MLAVFAAPYPAKTAELVEGESTGYNLTMPEGIEYLNFNEIKALLNAIDDTRDRAVITLFLNTGIFLNELIDLTIDSIDWDKRILKVPGSRKRDIPLNDQAFEALSKWSKERLESRSNSFFTTSKGKLKELSDRAVDKIIRKYAEQAGIKRRVNSQILRNTFAVRLFQEEISQGKAAAILGITDPDSINRYLQAAKQPPKQEMPAQIEIEKLDTRPKIVKIFSKAFPTKPKIAKPVTEIKGPIVPSPEEVVFGREGIIEDIKSNLNKNQPVLLVGPIGIGKTHILKHISKILGPNTLYLSSPAPLKNILAQICLKLDPDYQKQLKTRASTIEIINYITKVKAFSSPLPVKGEGSGVRVLIIDNLNNLKISDVESFTTLLENFTILGATDEASTKLKQVWWKFKQITLKPLGEEASKELIRYLTQNLSISDYDMLETRVLTLSNGLPLAIVDMIHQISHQNVVNKDVIREVYHEAGVHYRDWTAAIVVIWGIAIMFRFFALGTHSFEAYILAGFGTAFLMMMRFFMFRMR